MKKHALLTLLPFALVVVGCSGNLNKGSIFNEKFLRMNTIELDVKQDFEADNEVVLDLGSEVTPTPDLSNDDLLVLDKADGSKGYYDLSTRKISLPVDKWDSATIQISGVYSDALETRFFSAEKEVEGSKVLYIYDEYGNLLYSGKAGVPTFAVEEVFDFKTSEQARLRVSVDGFPKVYATYGLDLLLKEVLTIEEFLAKHPYDAMGKNLAEFGHEELIEKVNSNGGEYRHTVFNTKKNKYVATFAIPVANPIRIGDFYYYQTTTEVHEREKKYDYVSGNKKYVVTTHRVNYLNGKEKTIKTNILFSSFAEGSRNFVDAKNVKKYYFGVNVLTFNKDKTLNPIRQNILLDQKLKIVADVSGINLSELERFGDYYLIGKTVYDSKLREVGYLEGSLGYCPNIVRVGQAYGLVDHTGKFIASPVYDYIERISDSENYYRLYDGEVNRIVKLNEKEELQEIGSYSSKDYNFDHYTCSSAHVVLEKKEDHKKYVFNYLDGSFKPAKELETSDVLITSFGYAYAFGYVYITDAVVFQRGSEYRAIFNSTHTTYSVPSYVPTK